MSDVRERHRQGTAQWAHEPEPRLMDWCVVCGHGWPCDAIQQADRADALERDAAVGRAAIRWYHESQSLDALRSGRKPTTELRAAIAAALGDDDE